MPNRDGRGPEGQGPRTGRGLGNCSQSKEDSIDTNRPRRGCRDTGRQRRKGV
ncbi:MAG: DUF5320 domain-containing protein [Candidatus Woesearchaeota archaeon]